MYLNYTWLKNFNLHCENFLDKCFFDYKINKDNLIYIYNIYNDMLKKNIIVDFDSAIGMDFNSFQKIFFEFFELSAVQEKLLSEKNKNEDIDISGISKDFYKLKLVYLNYKKFMQINRILDLYTKIEKVNSSKEFHNKIPIETNKNLIYLDNNVITELETNENLFNSIINLNKKFQVIYSPMNIEEIAKRKNSDHIEALNKLSNLTNDIGVFRSSDDKIMLFKEHPIYSYNRILEVGFDLNEAVENYRLLVSLDNTTDSNNYNTQQHRQYINSNDNIINDNKCRKIFSKAVSRYGRNFSLEEYENLPPEFLKSYNNLNSSIYALMNGLMFVGYQNDKNKKKNTIRSGVYDVEHLIFASKANIFITHDLKFYRRSKIIFKILKINTKLIYFDKDSIIEELTEYTI